jgi:hypothetical protein
LTNPDIEDARPPFGAIAIVASPWPGPYLWNPSGGAVLKQIISLIALLSIMLTAVARADVTLNLPPSAVGQAEDSGNGYAMRSWLMPDGFWVGPSSSGQERGIAEYDLSNVSEEAAAEGGGIHAASLYIFWAAWSSSGNTGQGEIDPTVHIFGYRGDNQVTAADAMQTGTELASYTLHQGTNSFVTIPLPPDYVQDLLSTNPPSLGLLFTATSGNQLESAALVAEPPYPTLIINVPEPTTAALAGIAVTALAALRRRHRA